MKVIYKAPGQKPEILDIPNTLEALQEKVGGPIETVNFATDGCIICNEEGRLLNLPYNVHFLGISFVGPILFAGIRGESFTSLSEKAGRLIMLSIGGGKYGQP